ncbi:MAG TPA: hypothetical protein VGH64_14820 [Puia sp.]
MSNFIVEILKNPIVFKIVRDRNSISGIVLLIFFETCQQPEPSRDVAGKLEKISGAVSGGKGEYRSASDYAGFRCVKISS